MSHEDDATRGLTARELLLEVRAEVKTLTDKVSARPDRKEIYGVMVGVLTLGIALFNAIAA